MDSPATSAATTAETSLKILTALVKDETAGYLERNDIPGLLWHFSRLRDAFYEIKNNFEELEAEVVWISQHDIPTIFGNQHVKTIKIDGLGRCTINVRWFASMRKDLKPSCLDWLRVNKAEGLIIETVAAPSLAAFAKLSALDGLPLPDDLFDVYTKTNTSITKG